MCYFLVGLGWILFSDRAADALFRDSPEMLLRVSSFKGIGFVLATALLFFLLLHRHVSAYRRKEAELRESQERYRLVVENAPDAILIHDGSRFLFANPAAAMLLGVASPEALVGRPVLDFIHEHHEFVAAEPGQQIVGPDA